MLKWVWLLFVVILLPLFATGPRRSRFALPVHMNPEPASSFVAWAPYAAVGAGMLAVPLIIRSMRRAKRPFSIRAIIQLAPPCIAVVMVVTFSVTAYSLPIMASLFGAPGTSRTVSVMSAVGNVPCRNAFATEETRTSSFLRFICLSDEQRRRAGFDYHSFTAIRITGFGNELGIWFPSYEPVQNRKAGVIPSRTE